MLHKPPRRTQDEQAQQYRRQPPGTSAMQARAQQVVDTVRAKTQGFRDDKQRFLNPPEEKKDEPGTPE